MAQPIPEPCSRGLIEAEPCPRAAGREPGFAAKRWALIATVLASSMAFIDSSALTVALPEIARDFDADVATIQWVVNGYVLALAALTLVGGALADRFGRKEAVVAGTVVFGIASVACAVAPSVSVLVGMRIVQGIGAAILTPASLALLGEVYPRDERSAAIGAWAGASALTTALGPVLGGWLTESFGWEAIFLINPPIALVAVLILLRLPRGIRKETTFDLRGAVLLCIALGALAYAMAGLAPAEGGAVSPPSDDSGPTGAAALAAMVAIVAGLAFAWGERRSEAPMVPAYVLRNKQFANLNVATLFIYSGLAGVLFILPFLLIVERGNSATEAGLAFLPFTLAIGLLSQRMGALADKVGERPLLIAGPLIAASGFGWLALDTDFGSAVDVYLPLAVSGFGFALLVAPLTSAVMSSVAAEDVGLASGLNNTASRIAQMVGVSMAAFFAAWDGAYGIGLVVAAGLCATASAWLLVFGRDRA